MRNRCAPQIPQGRRTCIRIDWCRTFTALVKIDVFFIGIICAKYCYNVASLTTFSPPATECLLTEARLSRDRTSAYLENCSDIETRSTSGKQRRSTDGTGNHGTSSHSLGRRALRSTGSASGTGTRNSTSTGRSSDHRRGHHDARSEGDHAAGGGAGATEGGHLSRLGHVWHRHSVVGVQDAGVDSQ